MTSNSYRLAPSGRVQFDLGDFDIMAVPDPGKGVCADPVKRSAILEGEGPGPPSGDKEHQLSPDKERGKT